jgi:hypothetical protein
LVLADRALLAENACVGRFAAAGTAVSTVVEDAGPFVGLERHRGRKFRLVVWVGALADPISDVAILPRPGIGPGSEHFDGRGVASCEAAAVSVTRVVHCREHDVMRRSQEAGGRHSSV